MVAFRAAVSDTKISAGYSMEELLLLTNAKADVD